MTLEEMRVKLEENGYRILDPKTKKGLTADWTRSVWDILFAYILKHPGRRFITDRGIEIREYRKMEDFVRSYVRNRTIKQFNVANFSGIEEDRIEEAKTYMVSIGEKYIDEHYKY